MENSLNDEPFHKAWIFDGKDLRPVDEDDAILMSQLTEIETEIGMGKLVECNGKKMCWGFGKQVINTLEQNGLFKDNVKLPMIFEGDEDELRNGDYPDSMVMENNYTDIHNNRLNLKIQFCPVGIKTEYEEESKIFIRFIVLNNDNNIIKSLFNDKYEIKSMPNSTNTKYFYCDTKMFEKGFITLDDITQYFFKN